MRQGLWGAVLALGFMTGGCAGQQDELGELDPALERFVSVRHGRDQQRGQAERLDRPHRAGLLRAGEGLTWNAVLPLSPSENAKPERASSAPPMETCWPARTSVTR